MHRYGARTDVRVEPLITIVSGRDLSIYEVRQRTQLPDPLRDPQAFAEDLPVLVPRQKVLANDSKPRGICGRELHAAAALRAQQCDPRCEAVDVWLTQWCQIGPGSHGAAMNNNCTSGRSAACFVRTNAMSATGSAVAN